MLIIWVEHNLPSQTIFSFIFKKKIDLKITPIYNSYQ